MKQRTIAGVSVGEIGLGCMGMSHAYGPYDDSESLKVFDRAMELDCNFWDTADMYGAGKNEILVGKALKKHRDKVFLATKVGNVTDRTLTSHQDQVAANAPAIVDGTPEYIQKCADLSLQRLRVDVIDLYYLHRVDSLVPIVESVGAMANLVEQGKVRFLGLSEASSSTIRRAHKVHPISALQTEYSLWTRHVEEDIYPTCVDLGITFVSYSPLGRGFLAGKITNVEDLSEDDWRRKNARFQGENLKHNLESIALIRRIADKHGAVPAQIAIAWVLAKGNDIIPIPGTKRIPYLEENISAGNIILTPDEIKELEKIQGYGERYPAKSQKFIDE